MANKDATRTSPVNGGSGDDSISGNELPDVISGGSGNDVLAGAGGDDVLRGDAGDDALDGGAANDRVEGNAGDDVAVYVAAENAFSDDTYDGGAGRDTLRLVLTRAEWMRAEVQSDIAAYLAFMAGKLNPTGQAVAGTFDFTAFDLHAGMFEKLEVSVDGVFLDPRDEAVTAVADAAAVEEDGSVGGDVLANDSVPDLVRSVEVVAGPAHGTLVFNADGSYVYTPGAHFNAMAAGETAIETFQYRVTDADLDTATTLVTITITGTNDGPVVTNTAQELVGAVQEDGALTATGQLAAIDPDHDATQTWTVVGAASGDYGSIVVDAGGRWTYTFDNAAHQDLAQGESHDESFTVRVTDDQGAFADQTVTVTVSGTNDGPVITGGIAGGAVAEDAAATHASGRLLAEDPDHGAQQVWTVVGAGAAADGPTLAGGYGTLTVAQDGAWTYEIDNGRAATQALAQGELAVDSFTVRVTDEFGAFDTRTVDIEVVGTNDGPVIQTAGASRALGEDANVVAGQLAAAGEGQFSDVDLTDTHSLSAVPGTMQLSDGGALPAGLAAALGGAMTTTLLDAATGDGHGGYRWDFALNNAATQFLAAGQTLQATYAVTATDAQGASAAQPVAITIAGANDAPVVTAGETTGAVSALPHQPEAAPPLVFTVQQFLNHQSNNLADLRNYAATHAADYTVQANVIDYTDDPAGFAGELPGSSPWPAAQAQNVVGTGGINNVFFARITADFSVATADTYTFRTFNDDGVFLLIDNQLILQDTGYHPEAPFNGSIALQPGNHTIELFFYEDGGEASLEFSAKSSTGQFGLVGASGGGFGGANVQLQDTGTLAFADVDLTDAHLVSAAPVGAALGTLEVAMTTDTTGSGTGGQVAWTYSVPNAALGFLAAGETRTERFLVTLDDQHGGLVSRQVEVTVTGTNDVPLVAAGDVTGSVTEMIAPAGALGDSGTIEFQDPDLTDVHSVGAVTSSTPTLGTLTAGVTADTTGSGAGGVVTWHYSVPASAVESLGAGQSRIESFTFDVLDGQGGSVTRTVDVTIAGTNDAPVAAGDLLSANEDSAVTFTAAQLLANDSDVDAGAQLSIASVTSGSGGSAVLNADGTVTFTPDANFNGTASFSYRATDGAAQSAAATVAVEVAPVNDAPVAVDDVNALTVEALPSGAQSTFVNWVDWTSASAGQVVGTIDLGGGQTIGVTYSGEFAFAQTSGGTNYYTDYDNNGSPTTTTYTSPAVQNGPTGSDIIALSQASQKTLTFSQPVNDLFFAIVSLNGNGYLFDQDFSVMSYGQGYFGNGSATRVPLPDGRFSVVGSGELHGVLRIDGAVQSLTWTSQTPEYWNGFTVGTYGKAVTATVAGNLLANDSDVEGDALAVTAAGGQQIAGNSVTLDLASGARVKVDKSGAYVYDENGAFGALAAGQTAVDTFQYTVSDGHGGITTATASITVTGVNDVATFSGTATAEVQEDGTLAAGGTLAVIDVDAGEDTIAAPADLAGQYGTFAFDKGAWSYALDNGSVDVQALGAGEMVYDTLVVHSSDGTATQEIKVAIAGANDAPETGADALATTEDGTVSIAVADLLANDSDVEGDPLAMLSLDLSATAGSVTRDGDTLSYTPGSAFQSLPEGAVAIDQFVYTVSDGHGGTSLGTVAVTITGDNDAPTAGDDSAFVHAGTPVTLAVLANDSDPEHDALSVGSVSAPAHGSVSVGSTGAITYMPAAGYTGPDSFTYSVQDASGATDSATVSLVVGYADHDAIAGDVFLQGNYMEIGVSSAGSLGTAGYAPANYHPMDPGGRRISYVVDEDGWGTGAPPKAGDFTLPGSPVDTIVLGVNGVSFAQDQRMGYNAIATTTEDVSSGTVLAARTTGTKAGVQLTQLIELDADATYYKTTVTLVNVGSSTAADVRFLRSFDPDQDNYQYGTFVTRNDVLANPVSGSDIAVARATGYTSGVSVNLVSFDPDARVSNYGFGNYDAYAGSAWATPVDRNGALVDEAISLEFRFGDLAPGQEVTKVFYTSLNGRQTANDMSIGTPSADVLAPGLGDDVIIGLAGNDIMTGSAGNDRFVFSKGSGADRVNDFVAGANTDDVIELRGFGFTSLADVRANATQAGSDLVVDLGGGDSIRLVGVSAAALHADDFQFA